MKKVISVTLLTFILIVSIILCLTKINSKNTMTYEEKKNDGIYLLNFLERNYPFFNVKKQALGYDFLSNKEKLINKIANSKNDYEFYTNIYKTVCLLQNNHTKVLESASLPYSNNNKSPYAIDELKNKLKYWDNIKLNVFMFPNVTCKYIEGKYIVVNSLNPEIHIGDIIIKVNGIPVNTYALQKKDTTYLQYDFNRNVYYSNNLFMTMSSNKDILHIPITIMDKNSKIKNSKITLKKLDKGMTYNTKNINTKNISTKIIKKNDIAYLKVDSMIFTQEDIDLIENFFNDIRNYKNLIIDIRENCGGLQTYSDKLLSMINSNNIESTNYFCYRKSDFTDKYIENFFPEFLGGKVLNNFKDISSDEFNIYKTRTILPYSSNAFKGKVYLLTSSTVYSCSEKFANQLKRAHLATIIGTTTGGDGIGTGPWYFVLPNSKLCINIGVCMGLDSEGNINEKYHTQPDYYCEQSIYDYKQALENGITNIIGTKYDTILNKCIEIINNNN